MNFQNYIKYGLLCNLYMHKCPPLPFPANFPLPIHGKAKSNYQSSMRLLL